MGRMTLPESTISVHGLYRGLWRSLIATLALLVLAAGVARAWVVLPFLGIAFYLMTPYADWLHARARRVGIAIYPLIFAVLIGRIVDFQSIDELPATMIEIVAGFLPVSLSTHDKPRSFWLAVLNSAVIAVGCVTFTASILVYIAFMGFLLVLLFTLSAANLYLPDAAGEKACTSVTPRYFRQFLHVLPAGIFGAGLIFLSFPRVQSYTMSLDLGARTQTGYSGMISLADSGEIEESQALAFMVTSPDRSWLSINGPHLLFRGDSLDTFDGSIWKSTIFAYKSKEQAQDPRVASRHSQEIASLTVHREPTPNSTIFYPDILIDVVQQTPSSGEFLFNANGSVIRDVFTLNRYSYMLRIASPLVEAMLPREPVARLREELPTSLASSPLPYELTERDAQLYLSVPEGILDAAWFRAWVHELGIDPMHDSAITVAGKLARNFQDSFQPSLKNKIAGDNSLQAFLTSAREGHCEFFATAAVLLWRTLGLPARIVVGYRGGAFNHLIDALEVREDNAHAWLEVYLPKIGWHPFDPTPGEPPAFTANVASMLRMYTNAASFFFRQYVIDYDYRTQRDLLRSFREATRRNQTDAPSLEDLATRGTRPALIALAVIGVAFLALRRRMDAHDPKDLPRFYRSFERKMRRRGLARAPGETFAAFHRRCLERGIDSALLSQVDQSLEAELYADEELSRRQLAALRKAVDRL